MKFSPWWWRYTDIPSTCFSRVTIVTNPWWFEVWRKLQGKRRRAWGKTLILLRLRKQVDVPPFTHFQFPMVRQVFPPLYSQDITKVQPMDKEERHDYHS